MYDAIAVELGGIEDGRSGSGTNEGLKSIGELTGGYDRTIGGWETAVEGLGGRDDMRGGYGGVRMDGQDPGPTRG